MTALALIAGAFLTLAPADGATQINSLAECLQIHNSGSEVQSVYRHLRYIDFDERTFEPVPVEIADFKNKDCELREDARDAGVELIRQARREGWELEFNSCHRNVSRQQGRYCRDPDKWHPDSFYTEAYYRKRAEQSAPPGFSEHGTGLGVDFGNARDRGCNVEQCFNPKLATWLRNNAPHLGFELSFPDGNRQGVTYEPWHWRYVRGHGDVFRHAHRLYPETRNLRANAN